MEIYEHNKIHGNAPQKQSAPSNNRWRFWTVLCLVLMLCVAVAAVIGCRTSAKEKEQNAPNTESYQTAFAAVRDSIVQVWSGSKSGSGVVYKIRGGKTYILTNCHVIEGNQTASVRIAEHGELWDAVVSGYDAYHDVALIAVEGALGTPATVGGVPAVGQQIMAVGNNLGYGIAAFDGIVSRTNRMLYVKESSKNVPVYAVTAPINAGMSGGGLFTLDGKLVGLNTYQTTTVEGGDRIVDGTSYSVPVTIVDKIAQRILENESGEQTDMIEVRGSIQSGQRNENIYFTGLYFQAAFDAMGLYIDWVNPVAPDMRDGTLQEGDRLLRIGGLNITSQTEFHEIFAECLKYRDTTGREEQSGDFLTLQLQRGDETVTVRYEFKRLFYA